jgi:hypothetical protein
MADFQPPGLLMATLQLATTGLFAGLLGIAAWKRDGSQGTAPETPARRRRLPVVLLLVGGGLLLVAWATGGTLLFVPIWPVAFAILLAAALTQARGQPALVILALLVIAIGFAPAGTCESHWRTDFGTSGTVDEDVRLIELGGNGPRWTRGDGFGGSSIECSQQATAVGMAWAIGFVALATAAVVRGLPRREVGDAPT